MFISNQSTSICKFHKLPSFAFSNPAESTSQTIVDRSAAVPGAQRRADSAAGKTG
jgi:hypothetical protein